MNEQLLNHIQPILADNRSGSLTILNKVQTAFLDSLTDQDSQVVIEDASKALINQFPDFMVLHHFLDYLFKNPDNSQKESYPKIIANYREAWQNSGVSIALSFDQHARLTPHQVLFHSNSSSLQALADLWLQKNNHISIIQTMGRPALEGQQQAEALAKKGFPVTAVEDIAAAAFTETIGAICIGADTINDSHFRNKTGSQMLGLLAKTFGIPLYVLADSRKCMPSNYPDPLKKILNKKDSNDPEVVWPGAKHSNITVKNPYFEWVPNQLVTAFVTEKGYFSPEKLSAIQPAFSDNYLNILNHLVDQ